MESSSKCRRHRLTRAGSGESGKSTVVKQMKIIHQGGYEESELRTYRLTIYKNVTDCAKALIGAMEQFEIQPENPENVESIKFIQAYNVDPDPDSYIDPTVGEKISMLWKDPCMAKVNEHQSEFYLMDSAP